MESWMCVCIRNAAEQELPLVAFLMPFAQGLRLDRLIVHVHVVLHGGHVFMA